MASPWHEVSNGRYQRPVGENEKFMTLLIAPGAGIGREQWAVHSVATIRMLGNFQSQNLDELFRSAWKHLRFQHPSIASYEEDDAVNYLVPDTLALNKWCEDSFRVIAEDNILADDVVANHKPTKVATMHYLPSQSQLVLRTSHWCTDGIGILMLFDAFFAFASAADMLAPESLPWGEEVERLAPNVESAANLPTTITQETKAIADDYASSFGHYTGCVGIGFSGDGKTIPRGTRTVTVQLSDTETSGVARAVKARKISVTAAVHAAVASANYIFAPPEAATNHFASTIRFSLRPLLPEPYNTSAFASGLYTSGYISSIPATNTWSQNATDVNDAYRKGFNPELFRAHRQYAVSLQELVKNMSPDTPPLSNVDISSVGVIDEIVKPVYGNVAHSIEVRDITLGVETLTPQMVVFVWTFRGKLNLHPAYNEAFIDKEAARQFAEEVKNVLLKELQVRE